MHRLHYTHGTLCYKGKYTGKYPSKYTGKTLNKGYFLFHVGRVKSAPAKEVLVATQGFYLPVAGILFVLTRGFYSLLSKISSGSK